MLNALNAIEKAISLAILAVSPFFSKAAVWRYIDKEVGNSEKGPSAKDTIKSHFRPKRESIPYAYVKYYIEAWQWTESMPKKFKNVNRLTEEQETFASKNLDKLVKVVEKYEEFKIIFRCFPFSFFPEIYDNEHATDGFSPLFAFRLYKSFDALLTMTPRDLRFLTLYFNANGDKKEEIKNKIDESGHCEGSKIMASLVDENGSKWFALRRRYKLTPQNPQHNNYWPKFCKKAKNLAADITPGPNSGMRRAVLIFCFIDLIWPKENSTDTTFGVLEIDAMIQFKFFLTEEEQKKLLAEFGISDYSK